MKLHVDYERDKFAPKKPELEWTALLGKWDSLCETDSTNNKIKPKHIVYYQKISGNRATPVKKPTYSAKDDLNFYAEEISDSDSSVERNSNGKRLRSTRASRRHGHDIDESRDSVRKHRLVTPMSSGNWGSGFEQVENARSRESSESRSVRRVNSQ